MLQRRSKQRQIPRSLPGRGIAVAPKPIKLSHNFTFFKKIEKLHFWAYMHIYLQKLLYGGTENIIPDISILFFIKLVSQKAQLCEAIIGGY